MDRLIISLTRTGITGAPSFVKSSELGIQLLSIPPGFSSVASPHNLLSSLTTPTKSSVTKKRAQSKTESSVLFLGARYRAPAPPLLTAPRRTPGGRDGGGGGALSLRLVTNLLDLVSQHHRLPDGINKYTRTVSQCCQAVVKL